MEDEAQVLKRVESPSVILDMLPQEGLALGSLRELTVQLEAVALP